MFKKNLLRNPKEVFYFDKFYFLKQFQEANAHL